MGNSASCSAAGAELVDCAVAATMPAAIMPAAMIMAPPSHAAGPILSPPSAQYAKSADQSGVKEKITCMHTQAQHI